MFYFIPAYYYEVVSGNYGSCKSACVDKGGRLAVLYEDGVYDDAKDFLEEQKNAGSLNQRKFIQYSYISVYHIHCMIYCSL